MPEARHEVVLKEGHDPNFEPWILDTVKYPQTPL